MTEQPDLPLATRLTEFQDWLAGVTGPGWTWYVKRLAANDTLATQSHQVGPYFPKPVIFRLFPSIEAGGHNPDASFRCTVDSQGTPERTLRAIWYNQGTRDECRVTRWGGSASPVLDPDATGSVCVFAFHGEPDHDAGLCRAWLCALPEEELLVDRVGPIEPGQPLLILDGVRIIDAEGGTDAMPCWLTEPDMPDGWLNQFPAAKDIVAKSVELRKLAGLDADTRLLRRRDCEYEVFRSLETVWVLPRIRAGFESIDDFVAYGHSVSNRRKSRAGWSLELQAREILLEEHVTFDHGVTTEGNKKPDFLFPSAEAYHSGREPLAMLAAKTTCKDRWRQILNEADRIPAKHLLTVQEGVSENQFKEMQLAGVRLVVPRPLQDKYPKRIRSQLLSFEQFLQFVA